MSLRNSLVRIQANIFCGLFVCSYPLVLVAILVWKLYRVLICRRKEDTIEGEVALVTGGAHGLGRAIAIELATRGCYVAVVDINLQGAEGTVRIINDVCPMVRAKAYKVNVTSFEEIVELNKNITIDLGKVTVLVNNAGVLVLPNATDPASSDVQRLIDVNTVSHFWTKSIFLPAMKELRKGYIMTISSGMSLFPMAYSSAYGASKCAASGHMKALRLELAVERQNIHVCLVMPYFLDTNDEVVDIVNDLNVQRFYPLISGMAAAHRMVKGMLRHEKEITLPGVVSLLYRLFVVLPASWQDFIILTLSGEEFRKLKLRW